MEKRKCGQRESSASLLPKPMRSPGARTALITRRPLTRWDRRLRRRLARVPKAVSVTSGPASRPGCIKLSGAP
eukprot:scaffold1204_cov51-Phaeocystis_antarctica.AAC.3